MKSLKIILNILLILLFFVSAIFNILTFNSSYASLMFKYDKNLFEVMHTNAKSEITYEVFDLYIDKHTNQGFSVKGENIDGCDKFEATYYISVDDETKVSEIESSTVCTTINTDKKEVVTKYYFKNNVMFTDAPDIEATKENFEQKFRETGTFEDFRAKHPDAFDHLEKVLVNDLKYDSNKTKLDFSFSPFYTLGIKYSVDLTDTSYITYRYDLKGRIRKIVDNNDAKDSTLTINYKNKKVEFPDLTKFK